MNPFDWTVQLLGILLAIAAAPVLLGWVNMCRAWLQNKSAPSILQPYRGIRKLFNKDAVLAQNASRLFRLAPYVVFGAMVMAAAVIPSIATRLPITRAADAIALVGLLATARVFLSLAAMDVGTAFGTLGARREMMIGFLAEPALLVVIFVVSLTCATTALPLIAERFAAQPFALNPSLAFTAVAFTMVLLAENARIPIDNPATHLELTMVHEAMVLEYSGRHLAMIELSAMLKLLLYVSLIACVFTPWGLAPDGAGPIPHFIGIGAYFLKLAVAGTLLAIFETSIAKMRVFRVPEFLGAALMLGLLAALLRFMSRSF